MKGFPFFKPLLPALVLLGVGCGGDSTDDRTPAAIRATGARMVTYGAPVSYTHLTLPTTSRV